VGGDGFEVDSATVKSAWIRPVQVCHRNEVAEEQLLLPVTWTELRDTSAASANRDENARMS
jgi:hypothetical protein